MLAEYFGPKHLVSQDEIDFIVQQFVIKKAEAFQKL